MLALSRGAPHRREIQAAEAECRRFETRSRSMFGFMSATEARLAGQWSAIHGHVVAHDQSAWAPKATPWDVVADVRPTTGQTPVGRRVWTQGWSFCLAIQRDQEAKR